MSRNASTKSESSQQKSFNFARWTCDPTDRNINELVFTLGPLARLWLNDEVLQRSNLELPLQKIAPLGGLGATCILTVTKLSGLRKFFRPAFYIPVRWRKSRNSETHDARLPGSLRSIASQVVLLLKKTGDLDAEQHWTLHFHTHENHKIPFVLDALESSAEQTVQRGFMEATSAWAPLTVALLQAQSGVEPETNVWSTGSWNDGVVNVGSLAEKLTVADTFGISTLFVPFGDAEAAQQDAAKRGLRVQVEPFGQGDAEPKLAVEGILAAHLANVRDLSSRDDKAECYLNWRRLAPNRAQGQYAQLMPDVVEHLGQQLPSAWKPLRGNFTLVTTASKSLELVEPSIRLLNPKRILLFSQSTEGNESLTQGLLANASEIIKSVTPQVQLQTIALDENKVLEELQAAIEAFTSGTSPEQIVFDLQPGFLEIRLGISQFAAKPKNKMMFQKHRTTWINRTLVTVPFSQRLVTWQHGEDRWQVADLNSPGATMP